MAKPLFVFASSTSGSLVLWQRWWLSLGGGLPVLQINLDQSLVKLESAKYFSHVDSASQRKRQLPGELKAWIDKSPIHGSTKPLFTYEGGNLLRTSA